MKVAENWSYRPYKPFLFESGDIYICRIYPSEGTIAFDWLQADGAKEYCVHYKKRGDEAYTVFKTEACSAVIDGLCDDCDYEFYVSSGDKKSRVRLARTGFVPGESVVNYLHPDDKAYSFSGNYLCSPSIVKHPDGYLLASMDVFGINMPQNLTLIYKSTDNGKTWTYLSELFPCFWGTLFVLNGDVYMFSTSTEYGDLLIGRSTDGGKTFQKPTVLLRGSGRNCSPGCHKSPSKIAECNGRLWFSFEWGTWAIGGHAMMCASAPKDSDLLDPKSWRFGHPVEYDKNWPGTAPGDSLGCLEGCMIKTPEGELYDFMRYEIGRCTPSYGKAVLMKADVSDPEKSLQFCKVVSFPGNHSKFEIVYDPDSESYYSIVSYLCEEHKTGRNWLALLRSKDLEHWEKIRDIYKYTNLSEEEVGFQYVSFIIDGNDILLLSRTAFNHANNYHNSNYSTFDRIKNFREL